MSSETFRNQINLVSLELGGNKLNKWNPSLFNSLTKLQYLDLSENPFSNKLQEVLEKDKSRTLRELDRLPIILHKREDFGVLKIHFF
jgi:Leucine-rich repeat (LRR) protein